MGTPGRPLHALHALADLGVCIAIDDFGTGYSNLAYLQQAAGARAEAGRLVRHRRDRPRRRPPGGRLPRTGRRGPPGVVGLVIRLAHTLGLTVTAESVETRAQFAHLQQLGCDPGQGWFFAARCRRRGSELLLTPWAVRREPRPAAHAVACPGGGVQRGDPAAPAGPGRAGGAARAHGRPVLGPQGRRRLVAAQGRARPRRRPADRGGARVHRGAGLRRRRPARRFRWAPSASRAASGSPSSPSPATSTPPRSSATRSPSSGRAVRGGCRSSPRSTAPPGSGSTRPGAPPSAARCRSWIGSTPCWPPRTRVDRAGRGVRENVTPTDPRTAAPASPARVPCSVSTLRPRTPAAHPSVWRGLLHGAAAGAAGSTALNAVTYLDMVVRGRPAEPTRRSRSSAAWPARPGSTSGEPPRAAEPVRGPGTAGRDRDGRRGRRARRGAAQRRRAAAHGRRRTAAGCRGDARLGRPPRRARGQRPPSLVGGRLVSDAVPHLVYGVTTHATLAAASAADEERVAPARAPLPILLRAAALGAASGSRSTAGVTAVALASRRGDPGRVASGLGSTAGTAVSGVLALGELVSDKLPATPSRLAPPALGGRVLLGGTAAAAEARRDGTRPGAARARRGRGRGRRRRARQPAARGGGAAVRVGQAGRVPRRRARGPPGLAGSAPAVGLISGNEAAGAGRLAARRRPPAAFF